MSFKALVLVPLYNEEDNCQPVIVQLRNHYQGDALVVDDGSTDRSVEQLRELNDERLKIIQHGGNLGYGAALTSGFQYAMENRYDVVVSMDCDFQHCPQQIPRFLAEWQNADILSGSRYLQTSPFSPAAPPDRVRINKIVTDKINAVTSFGITDAFCGYKAYRVSALSNFKITETGYGMPLQLWIQAYAAGLSVKELSVARLYPHLDRSFGGQLDDPQLRLEYYENVINEELKRCKLT